MFYIMGEIEIPIADPNLEIVAAEDWIFWTEVSKLLYFILLMASSHSILNARTKSFCKSFINFCPSFRLPLIVQSLFPVDAVPFLYIVFDDFVFDQGFLCILQH